jgi:hypothetical protein
LKVRRIYSKRKFREHYQAEFRNLSKELLIVKGKSEETFLHCKHVKRCKEIEKNILAIEGCNDNLITNPIEKVNSLTYRYN